MSSVPHINYAGAHSVSAGLGSLKPSRLDVRETLIVIVWSWMFACGVQVSPGKLHDGMSEPATVNKHVSNDTGYPPFMTSHRMFHSLTQIQSMGTMSIFSGSHLPQRRLHVSNGAVGRKPSFEALVFEKLHCGPPTCDPSSANGFFTARERSSASGQTDERRSYTAC